MGIVFSTPDAGLQRNLRQADEVADGLRAEGRDAVVKSDPTTDTWNVHVPDED
ncbi:hypothetical protein [Streptomyces sp. NRRL S-455]|uniref:hypothetical protein n=1 Tax=Streptomyces sp. NRRL S-455 TaxID=1463908 RepID=UPI000AF03881|nr:hypothetical protein [Streptomyces sp. NRRL S-455]